MLHSYTMITKQSRGGNTHQTLWRVFEIIKDNFSRKVSVNGLESLLKMHKYDSFALSYKILTIFTYNEDKTIQGILP